MSHEDAIKANAKAFNQDYWTMYDQRSSMQKLTSLFVKVLIEYNGDSTEKFYGDSEEVKTPLSSKFIKPEMRVLDFACGTGLVAQKLAPYLSKDAEIVGIDISEEALTQFDLKMKDTGLKSSSHIFDIIDKASANELKRFEGYFDLIVCNISYHHINNYRDVTKKLATFLRKGGSLVILDFYNSDVEKIEMAGTSAVQHMGGLAIDELNKTLGGYAGLINVNCYPAFKTYAWQSTLFIKSHCSQKILELLNTGKLEKKEETGMDVYWIENEMVLAVGEA